MSPLSPPIIVFFLVTVLVALLLFRLAVRGSRSLLIGVIVWIAVQSAMALNGYYENTSTFPPHFAFAVVPPLIFILLLFALPVGRWLLDTMDLRWSVLLHSIRILVEITLYWLFVHKQVSRLMTLEGGDIDILIGLSTPVIWWAFRTGKINSGGLLLWNALALLSVLNAVTRAMLTAPFLFQRFSFDQPTVAILTFPFVLLPAFIVPAVLLCHLAVFRRLSQNTQQRYCL